MFDRMLATATSTTGSADARPGVSWADVAGHGPAMGGRVGRVAVPAAFVLGNSKEERQHCLQFENPLFPHPVNEAGCMDLPPPPRPTPLRPVPEWREDEVDEVDEVDEEDEEARHHGDSRTPDLIHLAGASPSRTGMARPCVNSVAYILEELRNAGALAAAPPAPPAQPECQHCTCCRCCLCKAELCGGLRPQGHASCNQWDAYGRSCLWHQGAACDEDLEAAVPMFKHTALEEGVEEYFDGVGPKSLAATVRAFAALYRRSHSPHRRFMTDSKELALAAKTVVVLAHRLRDEVNGRVPAWQYDAPTMEQEHEHEHEHDFYDDDMPPLAVVTPTLLGDLDSWRAWDSTWDMEDPMQLLASAAVLMPAAAEPVHGTELAKPAEPAEPAEPVCDGGVGPVGDVPVPAEAEPAAEPVPAPAEPAAEPVPAPKRSSWLFWW